MKTATKAMMNFIGHLSGVEKSENTIASYKLDLNDFKNYLLSALGKKQLALTDLNSNNLFHYKSHLEQKNLKPNTVRRMILSNQRFIEYLTEREKLPVETARKVPPPQKEEKQARIFDYDQVLTQLLSLPKTITKKGRPEAMLLLLCLTGILPSEFRELRLDQFECDNSFVKISLNGRTMVLKMTDPGVAELRDAIHLLKEEGREYFYPTVKDSIEEFIKKTFRGTHITARTFRATLIHKMLSCGEDCDAIKAFFGLKSDSVFKAYKSLMEKRDKTK